MNTTTLGIAAVLALTIMVVAGLVVTPVFAGSGNTIIKFSNKAKATASGFGSLAANVQQNQINFGGP
jgi:hypothetical protein